MRKNKLDMASNYSEAPDAKKPCRGILKTSSSFDRPSLLNHRKSAKFDELNVLQTFHPVDKDYGHMKIDEPKTPYRVAEGEEDSIDQLDAEQLAEKLRNVPSRSSFSDFGDSPDEDETDEERVKRKEFEKRRKAHYNEFEAVRQARLLMKDEDDDDDDDDDDDSNRVSSAGGGASSSGAHRNADDDATASHMDVDSTDSDNKPSSSGRQQQEPDSTSSSSALVADEV